MPSDKKPLLQLKDTANSKERALSWANVARGLNNFFFDPYSKIHKICEKGDIAKLQEMLENCPLADREKIVNTLDDTQFSPLYYAVKKNHIECAKLLLLNKADANFKCTKKPFFTLLHNATASAHVQMAGLLLYYGADPKKRDSFGHTPFAHKGSLLAEALEYKNTFSDYPQGIEPKKTI